MSVSIPAAFETLARHDIELLGRFVRTVDREYKRSVAALDNQLEDLPEKYRETDEYAAYVDMLSDEATIAGLARNLGAELAIVALYRVVEIRTKRVLAWRYGFDDVKRLTAPQIAEKLEKDGIDIQQVSGFDTIDELRKLNNRIKHEAELGEGLQVEQTDSQAKNGFQKYADAVPSYLRKLAERVIPSDRKGG